MVAPVHTQINRVDDDKEEKGGGKGHSGEDVHLVAVDFLHHLNHLVLARLAADVLLLGEVVDGGHLEEGGKDKGQRDARPHVKPLGVADRGHGAVNLGDQTGHGQQRAEDDDRPRSQVLLDVHPEANPANEYLCVVKSCRRVVKR